MTSEQVVVGDSRRSSDELEKLAERQYRELENGRLAMLAFAGLQAQSLLTGQAVGLTNEELSQLTVTIGSQGMADTSMVNALVTALIGIASIDGIRRIAVPTQTSGKSMAEKAVNISRLQFGMQDPKVPLPAGVVAGQLP